MVTLCAAKIDVRSPFIDDSVLTEIHDFMGEDGDATIADLVSIYLQNTPKTIALIGQDLKNDDMEALKAHVHALKGSSAGVGVVGISTPCKEIEECLRNGMTNRIYDLFEKILRVFREVEVDFQTLL
jgi:HPt (histidine-containing phosphotransfer) domain-containing protein